MQILQTIIQKLACVIVLAAGAALILFSLSGLYEAIIAQIPEPNQLLRMTVGVVAIVLAAFALAPMGLFRSKSRELRFEGDSGSVTAQLDSIAASLNKTFNALPVVKKGTIRLTPTKAADKANVHADVQILIPAGSSLRETSTQLQVYLKELACSRIGGEEIECVSVNVTKAETGEQPVDMKSAPAEVVAPAAAAAAEPIVVDEEPLPVYETSPASEELVSYDDSAQAAEEEERSLTGELDDEPEPELAVPWNSDDDATSSESIEDDSIGDEPNSEDTSFDAVAIEESTADDSEDEDRPASGV